MVRIKEIALITKVSAATVSNVLNGKPGAASEAKAREIIETARSLHYTQNTLAKNLKKQKTNTIGIVTEDLTVFNTPEIVDGIDAFCMEQGYEIILGNMRLNKLYDRDYYKDYSKYSEQVNNILKNMLAKQVEGIVYVGSHCREIPCLPSWVTVPLVYAYCYSQENIYPSVLYDDEKAAEEVTELLIVKGHRKIGVLCGPKDSFHTQTRLEGFRKALAAYGHEYDPDMVLYGDWDRSTGYRLSDQFMDKGVTAIFSFNDLMAAGVYDRAVERGLAVGKNISLFGFDNREISQGYIPSISTVEVPLNAMGRKCAEIILGQIKHRRTGKKRIYLPCIIRERNSVSQNPYPAAGNTG
jgi:LacI family transcriptional regulator